MCATDSHPDALFAKGFPVSAFVKPSSKLTGLLAPLGPKRLLDAHPSAEFGPLRLDVSVMEPCCEPVVELNVAVSQGDDPSGVEPVNSWVRMMVALIGVLLPP